MRKKVAPLLFVATLMFGGCSNAVVEHTKAQPKVEESKTNHKKGDTKVQLPTEEKTPQEIINSMEKEKVPPNHQNVAQKESYSDANEFAVFVGGVLQKYFSGSLSPEEYYDFVQSYGATGLREQMPSDKEEAIPVYRTVQQTIQEKMGEISNYQISRVEFVNPNLEGYFYRQWQTPKGTVTYITTIIKEDEVWKVIADQPSAPVIIQP
jgi:hypothetical protein